ncbi:hybrid sensor histidine kinase/response regulator [Duganella sp. BJB488]|uniref:response regulator n=1 Tax=unclassified Duganella TaxID=2636909 RepID=UPI000E356BBE|nr:MULTISPECIES: response regulator [unclassified Duganella]RFP21870.1 hybrid sensor histidine kinase/response regulator [Duganella sp. BJB489]RFP23662.1 hybrid sensor histidine kinase/response regulator [Duganella sp. BJB488]RFP38829.1 hybrid sensor histidine kinase/response regulator [Duganella sp. BJB480]
MNPTEQQTILIVDDIPANLDVLVNYLEENQFRVLVAQDGEEALERCGLVQPDLVLLDVMMPGIDGLETCRRLKQDSATAPIPVIFMTALTDSENVVAAFDAGGVDYVTKPIRITEVLARIHTHLALRAMHRQLMSQNSLLQEANDRLLQAEKMASIGQLAAGVAHEINNPIGFVNSNMGSLQTYVTTLFGVLDDYQLAAAGAPEVAARIAQLKDAAEVDFIRDDFLALMSESRDGLQRVKDIVQSLKDFSHGGSTECASADLHRGLDSTLNIVNNEIKYKAEIVKEYGKLPPVMCVASQLNQVFMNLLVNAAHAIDGRGLITIRTGVAGQWVWIEISDTGGGMAPETVHRIFEPFYTTKPIGTGTGLGLSVSYGIVKRHGGRIDVESELGKGSRFTVHLPIHGNAAA